MTLVDGQQETGPHLTAHRKWNGSDRHISKEADPSSIEPQMRPQPRESPP